MTLFRMKPGEVHIPPSSQLAAICLLLLLLPSGYTVGAASGEDDQEGSTSDEGTLFETTVEPSPDMTTVLASDEATTLSRIPRPTTATTEAASSTPTEMVTPSQTQVEVTTTLMSSTEASTMVSATTVDENIPSDECRVPAYSNINYEHTFANRTLENSHLVLEGKCYTNCTVSALDFYQRYIDKQLRFSAWPYYTIRPLNCNPHKFVHECTRGCFHRYDGVGSEDNCIRDCLADCQNECETFQSCSNPDSDEWWVRKECDLKCTLIPCQQGCTNNITCTGSDLDCEPPPDPVAPPTLTPVVDSSRAGVYVIDLSNTVPTSSTPSSNVVFLFEVQDLSTGNYSYIWVVDPTVQFDLADFACREVLVRFAVANKYGLSKFSQSTHIQQVYGDPTRRPNAVTNVRVLMQQDDTRVGYLGHVVWTIAWDHPQNDLHLDGYTVDVFTHDSQDIGSCGGRVWSRHLQLNESTVLTVMTDVPGNLLIMGCFYAIQVHALGPDENEVVTQTELASIFPSRTQFIEDFQCNKIWDTNAFKFSFNFTWSLPLNVAHEDPVAEYVISLQLLRVDSSIPVSRALTNVLYVPPNKRANETSFYYYVFHNGNSFFLPQNDPAVNFRFKLFVNFNRSKVRFPYNSPSLPRREFICFLDAVSPAPSPVQNFTLVSYELLSTNKLSLNCSWVPPLFPNGALNNYNVCLSQEPLQEGEEPVSNEGKSFCKNIEGNRIEASMELNFISHDSHYCLYFQIRARNNYVAGNWNEPAVIYLGAPDSCSEPHLTTTISETTSTTVEDTTTTDIDVQDTTTTDIDVHFNMTPVVIGLSPSIQPSNNAAVVIGVPVTIAIIVILSCCIFIILISWCCVRRRKRNWRVTEVPSSLDFMYNGGPRRHLLLETPSDPQQPEVDEWEISPSEVLMEDSLGEGAFGEVYKGIVKGPLKCGKVRPALKNAICIPVAIKLLKDSARGSERQDFLSEIEMMKTISEGQNPNVIGLVGCVTIQEPLSLILEFVPFGDLLSYLRTNMKLNAGYGVGDHDNPYLQLGDIQTVDLVKFAYQIASGMEYLSSLGIVHRDLACRNILVSEGKVLKITDFGMSREVDEIYVQQSKGRVPLKWMALESILTREFTTASDVWSYGVTLWEIGTMGGFPYPSISNEDLVPLLKSGYRMEKPDNCSPEVYDIMLSCWNGDPGKRPPFKELRAKFDRMLQSNAEYIYFLPINSDKPCYRPENAPEGVTLPNAPEGATLSPQPASNRISLLSYRGEPSSQASLMNGKASSHQSMRSGHLSGRSSGHSSPGQRSPRSLSPTNDPSPFHCTPSGAQRSASFRHSQDDGHDRRKRARNLYVDDPSKLPQGNVTEIRPSSMLVTRQPAATCSSNPSIPTSDQGVDCHHRPQSEFVSHEQGRTNGVPGYVNMPTPSNQLGSSVDDQTAVLEARNPLYEMHEVTGERAVEGEEQGNQNGVPNIQITVTEDTA